MSTISSVSPETRGYPSKHGQVVASLAWRIEQAAISALSSMSDRALRHIGLTRSGTPQSILPQGS
ncbi:MAG: DUF1127 domain-containing protein [Pseudolabrys sp.]